MADITLGPDDDVIFGETGIDVIDGGGGSDTIDYSASLHGVVVDLAGGSARGVALLSTTFNDFTSGTINGQQGWVVRAAGMDQAIVDLGDGNKALHVSNAATTQVVDLVSPSFGPFGETGAINGTPIGRSVVQEFDVRTVAASAAGEAGLSFSASFGQPASIRMTYLGITQDSNGFLHAEAYGFFGDLSDQSVISDALEWGRSYHVTVTADFIDGQANDSITYQMIDNTTFAIVFEATVNSWEAPVFSGDFEPSRPGTTVNTTQAQFNVGGHALNSGVLIDNVKISYGEIGVDTLISIENATGTEQADLLIGSAGDNVLTGLGGNDTIDGGDGDDTIIGGAGADTLGGGIGDDTFVLSSGENGDVIDGGTGNDTLAIRGSTFDDSQHVTVIGGIFAGHGETLTSVENITLDLGTSDANGDTLSYAGSTDAITVNLATGTATGFTSIANIENVVGGSNADSFTSGAGSETFDGGDGTDTVTFAGARADYQANNIGSGLSRLIDLRTGSPDGTDTLERIETIVFSDGSFTAAEVFNAAPTGSVTIAGTAAEDETLTVSNTLADADGLGSIGYQWQRNGADVVGATAATYVLGDADVGATISVIASYTDDYGTLEAVSSTPTGTIANVNDTPTGTVTIAGTATEDQTLTASNTLADLDGLGTIAYQWQRNGADISGATAATYMLGDADAGASIRVIAGYADGQGTPESIPSTATGAVANVNDPPVATNLTQTRTYTEGDASVALDDIVVTEFDAGDTVTATLTLNNPATGVLTTSGAATFAAGVWSITGSVTDVNDALAAVSFTPEAQNDLDTTITVYIQDAAASGPANGTITLDVAPVPDAPMSKLGNDFNGDARSDILWQNNDGSAAIWLLDGTSLISGANVGFNPNAGSPGPWQVIDSGDFSGDGKADILWQHADGTIAEWQVDGTTLLSGGNVAFNPGPSWHARSTGDFNADGKADILWQNDDGAAAVWLMDGLNILSGANVGANPGAAWHVIDSGDFSGDSKSDILWQNNDGTAAVWLMDGLNVLSGADVGFNPGSSWNVESAGDFDGDGKADILWQHDDGSASVWLMDGTSLISGADVGLNPGPAWDIHGTGDFDGDGKADILWQNEDGTPAVWLMDGQSVISGADVGPSPGQAWHVIPPHHDLLM